MDVIDLDAVRARKNEEDGPPLNLVTYGESADLDDLIFLTVDGDVVLLTHPKELKGIHLSPEQAADLGAHLLRNSAMAEFAEVLQQVVVKPE